MENGKKILGVYFILFFQWLEQMKKKIIFFVLQPCNCIARERAGKKKFALKLYCSMKCIAKEKKEINNNMYLKYTNCIVTEAEGGKIVSQYTSVYCDQGARQLGIVPTTRRRGAGRRGVGRAGRAGARAQRACRRSGRAGCAGAAGARSTAGTRRGRQGAAGARGTTQGPGARDYGRGLGVPVRRLVVLVGSVGPVRVFGAPSSVLTQFLT